MWIINACWKKLFHKKSLTDSKLLNGTVYSTLNMVTWTEHPIPFIAIVACSTDFNLRGAVSEFSVRSHCITANILTMNLDLHLY